MATSFAQFTGSGSGTENDPYLILNPIQLNQLRNFLNQSGVYFKLMADIDLTEFLEDENPDQGWQPVGNSSSPFKGVLDGNGKTVSGLWINRSSLDYVGFFGNFTGGTIMNLTLKGSYVKGNNYVGFLAGLGGTIENCAFDGSVLGASFVGGCCGSEGSFSNTVSTINVEGSGDYVGGFSGQNGKYQNCKLNNSYIRGNNYVGGICGSDKQYHNQITYCYVYSNIYGNDNVGGMCGYKFDESSYQQTPSTIKFCGFSGTIEASNNVGGICGYYYGGQRDGIEYGVDKCYAIGQIKGSGNCIGGIVGFSSQYTYNSGKPYYNSYNYSHGIKDCYYSGSITGNEQVGSIVGYLFTYVDYKVTNCYSMGSVVGYNSVGGLVGHLKYASITNSVGNNNRLSARNGDVARLIGKNEGKNTSYEENKSYNRTIVIKQGVVQEINDDIENGAGVSRTTLKLKATYVAMGWDFTDTWEIQETECYPYMKSQTAPPVITSQLVSGATSISGKCVDGGTVTLEIDGVKQQMVSTGNTFSFTVSPLQAGHEVRVSAKADGKEQSYFTTEVVSFLGKGTEADPYQISTAADLTQVYRKGYYKLMNDIDLTSYINQFCPTEGWQSIGRDGSETIHFDGNGHKITGLWCNSTRDNTGLFSCFANGNIKDLTVETAAGKQVKGGSNTGILIGKMINGTIENCKVTGTVADGTPVGGMVGLFDGGEILKCQASVTINTTASTTYAGGLVGEITGGTIDQCATQGTLTATGATSFVGGLVGTSKATVTNSYSTATVTSSYNAAGIVAYNYGVVDMCYATGNLYSNNYAAGVIGYNDGANAIVRNCVAMNNKIDVTYESQQVQQGGGYGQRIIGGIKNDAPAPEMNNYALKTMQVSLNDVPQKVYDDLMNGTAKTAIELKQKAIYQELDWDFDNVWQIDEDESYPYQTVKVDDGSDPEDPNNPDNPDDPQGEVEVTDISTISNVIYIESMEEMCGTQATISLKMKNTAAIRGFQFDFYLPEGVTVVKSSKGKIQGFLSEDRLPDEDEHTLTFSEQPDGAIRFLCSSQYDETFTGNDGEIATLRVNIAEDMTDGDYLLQLKNIKLTETDISKYYETPLVKCKLTIKTYTLGDINSDGVVDVSDYTGVANHIHGNTPEGFVVKAGDVDESGTIDVSDYTGIANIIHTGSIYGSNTSRAMSRSPKKVNTDISSMSNIVYIDPFNVSAGEQTTLSIKMKNSAAIRGFQFDLYLPEGMTAAKSNKGRIIGSLSAGRLPDEDGHELTFSEQQDGAIRFLCSSQYDETFTGNDGEIATLTINIDAGVAVGDYPVYLRNMKLTETDISKFYTTEEVETTVTVTGTADGRVVLDETSTTAPDVANGVDVRVKRTINAGEWSTICLPFAMTAAQCQAAFGSDVEIGDFTGYTYNSGEDKITVNFSSVTAIEANHPYIIKVSAAVTEFSVDGVDVNPADDPRVSFKASSKKLKDFVGTYVADFDFYNDAKHTPLFLSGNKFWYATESTKHMKAFRAYFDFVDMLSEVDAARVAIAFDEATVINDVRTCSDDRYYNLSGQQVETPTKGVYVKNGKKVIVK